VNGGLEGKTVGGSGGVGVSLVVSQGAIEDFA